MSTKLYWKPAGSLICVWAGTIEDHKPRISGVAPAITLTEAGREIFGLTEIHHPGVITYFPPETDETIPLGYSTGQTPNVPMGVLLTEAGIDYSNENFNKEQLSIVSWQEFAAERAQTTIMPFPRPRAQRLG